MGATVAITAHMLIVRITTPTREIVGIPNLKTLIAPTIIVLPALPTTNRNGVTEANNAFRIDATLIGVRIAEVLKTARVFAIETHAMIFDATTVPTLFEAASSAKSLTRACSKGTTQGEQSGSTIAAQISMKSNSKETTSTSNNATMIEIATQGQRRVPPGVPLEVAPHHRNVQESPSSAIALRVRLVASMTMTMMCSQNAM
jgi:hypothetical protein